MPQLKSGRHFGLEPRSIADGATTGTPEQMYAFVLAYRLSVREPRDLSNFLPVIYFKENEGVPPDAPAYRSGFMVKDVIDGKAGWSNEEIEEFKEWVETNEAVQSWLQDNFSEIDLAIRDSPLWNSELMSDL